MQIRLQKQLKYNKYECPICYNKIYKNQKIWHCYNCCFSIYHFKCMKEWTKKKEEWQCPKCNYNYTNLLLSCWCGKKPTQCCGSICDKLLSCNHTCPLVCHPGPCPPCEFTSTDPIACYCGKEQKYNVLCKDLKEFSCQKSCDKRLTCQHHNCTQLCHPQPCHSCTKSLKVSCFCLSTSKTVV